MGSRAPARRVDPAAAGSPGLEEPSAAPSTLASNPMLRALALAAAACSLLLAPLLSRSASQRTLDAGTALRLDIDGLVEGAELVLEGRVLSRIAYRTARGRVATEYELDVLRTFQGDDLPRRTVRLPGGVLSDGSGVLIAGLPHLVPGEDAILFLTEEGSQGTRMPVGLAQGKLRVATTLGGSKVLVRDHAGLELVAASGAALGHGLSQEHLDYAATVAEIHAAAHRKRQGGR